MSTFVHRILSHYLSIDQDKSCGYDQFYRFVGFFH
jgi:hypothetical protein